MPKKQALAPSNQSNGTKLQADEEDHVIITSSLARETQCGLGSCRPEWLQRGNNMMTFTTVLSLWSLFGSINFSYYTAVITQIEKAYGLSSSMTGFIKNVDNIGYVCFVIIFSHFCRYANKPRLFAIATVCSSSAIFIFALPHFIFGIGEADEASFLNQSSSLNQTSAASRVELCDGFHEEETQIFCNNLNRLRSFNGGALALFILSELLQGMAQSPKFTLSMTYMDDNAKDKSPRFFAFMFSMRAFAPVIGFMLGAWATSLYVDLSDPDLSPKDPRWVGAWWLGFVICACGSLIWAFPMLLFPPKIPTGKDENLADARRRERDEGQSIVDKAKDLPKAMARLFKNKLYITVVLAICVEIYIIGFVTFLPKYMESYFGLTASFASMITGIQGAFAWSVGPLISSLIVTRKKNLSPLYLMKIIVVMSTLSTLLFAVTLFIECPQEKWGGEMSTDGPIPLPCASNCSCDSQSFNPVCGSDGVNYFTPCHAGCAIEIQSNTTKQKLYGDCLCIDNGAGTAISGVCEKECNTFIVYSIVLFLSKFIASMDIIPTMTVLMRCVSTDDKATALAGASAIMQVVSFPAPMVFGAVIDGACKVLQGTGACSSRKGACLLYDTEKFKFLMHGFVVGIKAIGILLYLLALFFSRNMVLHNDEPDKEEKQSLGSNSEVKDNQNHIEENEMKLLSISNDANSGEHNDEKETVKESVVQA